MAKDIRERILIEALSEINCRDSDFHMDDLARDLRISKRTLYEHFSSKQEIVREAIYSLMAEIHEQHMKLLADTQMTTEEKIIGFFNVKSPNIKVLSVRNMNDLLVKMPDLCSELEERSKKDWELLEQLLNKALQSKEFKQFDRFLLMHMLRSAADDIIEYFNEIDHDYSFSEYMEKCIRIILYGIKKDRGQSTNDTKA